MMDEERLRRIAAESLALKQRFFEENAGLLVEVGRRLCESLRAGGKVLTFGNGGSAADAQHFAGELVGRFLRDRPGLPALALTTDASVLTALANDFGYEAVFKRQIEAHGRPGDVAVGISTSGKSPNVLEGLRAARGRRLVTVGLCGEAVTPMRGLCDHVICVPSRTTARIQEVHILVGHILCQIVDETLYPAG